MFPRIIDISSPSPSMKRTQRERNFLQGKDCSPEPLSSMNPWQHVAVEKDETTVVAGSVDFLMREEKEEV